MSESAQGHSGDESRAFHGARRVTIGAALGAAIALTVTSVLSGGMSGGAADEGRRAAFTAPAGSCLDWNRPDGSDVQQVDCAGAHVFEAVGPVNLTSSFNPAAPFPTDVEWLTIVQEECTPLATTYLDERYDPFGRYTVGALKPSRQGWRNGDRTLHCGLQVVARSGELYRVLGPAAGQDQAAVHEPGTCLGIDGVDVADPVDCAAPHAVEIVGVVDLSLLFPDPAVWPDEPQQDAKIEAECIRIAAEYAGGPTVVTDKKLTVFWDTLAQPSWTAGTRRVACKLAALLPDKSGFAPVTGGVRGPVTVGAEPAAPAPVTATPGAPADDPPLTPVPSSFSATAASVVETTTLAEPGG